MLHFLNLLRPVIMAAAYMQTCQERNTGPTHTTILTTHII
jgi:hypothetical protein